MANASYRFNDGVGTTYAETDPFPAAPRADPFQAAPGGGDDGYGAFFGQIIQDQMARKKRLDDMNEALMRRQFQQQMQPQQMQRPVAPHPPAAARPQTREAPYNYQDELVKNAQTQAALDSLGRAPLRYTPGGFGMDSHLEMDDKRMSAPQRQAFLPQSAETGRRRRDDDYDNPSVLTPASASRQAQQPRYYHVRGE